MQSPTHTATPFRSKNGAADLRINKLHGTHLIRVSSDHNLRQPHDSYVKVAAALLAPTARIKILHGPAEPTEIAEAARRRRQQAGITKLRKNQVVALEVLVTLRPGSCDGEETFFRRAVAWVAAHFGGWPNILSAVVHHDEAAPHMHVLVMPLVDGKMGGSAMVGGPGKLRALRNSFQTKVCSTFGLSMPTGALRGTDKHNASSAVLDHIDRSDDSVKRSGVWTSVQDLIRRDPRPFLQELGMDAESFRAERRLRSMAEIFTGKGKGPQYRRAGDAP